jgi:hypothetical protein
MTRSIPKYTDDYSRDSPHVAELRDRNTVRTALWGHIPKKLPWCAICKGKRYVLKENNYYYSNCGHERPTATAVQEEMEKKLNLKHGQNTGPLIISQVKKRRRNILEENGSMTEEDLEDLAAAGIYPASFRDYFV